MTDEQLDSLALIKDIEVWISTYIAVNKLEFRYESTDWVSHETFVTYDSQHLTLRMWKDSGFRKDFGKNKIGDYLNLWVTDKRRELISGVRNKITFTGLNPDIASNFMLATTGERDEINTRVLQHFIWSVKRKINHLPVDHHMMPIFVGGQGTGKTVAISKLLSPISQIVGRPTDLSILSDERQMFRLATKYALFFDEMSKANKVDVNALKQAITSPTVSWRNLGFNSESTQANNATFIGASNSPVVATIYDPTGNRRFWEISCPKKMDWSLINSLDYTQLWASVDETAPSPILSVLAQIQSLQAETKVQDTVEEFIDYFNSTNSILRNKDFSPDEIHQLYLEYKGVGAKHLGRNQFLGRLKHLGYFKRGDKRAYNIFKETTAQ